MKLRVANSHQATPLKVILEPWAVEFDVLSGDYIDFVASKEPDEKAFFTVEHRHDFILVVAEWPGALISCHDSKGNSIF